MDSGVVAAIGTGLTSASTSVLDLVSTAVPIVVAVSIGFLGIKLVPKFIGMLKK